MKKKFKKYAQYAAKKNAKYAKQYTKYAVYVNHFPICKNYANYAPETLLPVMAVLPLAAF